MEHYAFVRSCLAWIASVACLFPATVPLLFLAYRIREGRPPEDDDLRMENDEIWKRSALTGVALALLTGLVVFTDVVLAKWFSFPAGVIHFVLFLVYFAAAAYVVMYFFAYEDYFAGLAQWTIFIALPMVVIVPLNWLLGLWLPVTWFEGWLKAVT